MIPLVFIVNQNHAFAGDENRHIAAIAFDLIKIVMDLIDLQLRRLALILRISHPGEQEEQTPRGNACQNSSVHVRKLYQILPIRRSQKRLERCPLSGAAGARTNALRTSKRHKRGVSLPCEQR